MEYEVVIEKHWSGKTYNVRLNSYEKNGWGMGNGRAFDVSYKKAIKVAEETAKTYNAEIIKKEGVLWNTKW